MTQTAWVLSLSQFYLSLGFMLFFLALELGLAWVLFGFRLRARASQAALLAYRFWVRVFALSLILGFAASLPLLLQLGTLWPDFMARAGEVAGPLVGMAVLTAFIFKSCFLGAMLYGQRSLSDRAHTLVVGMVAVGTSLTAWWIAALLAWLQWPAGAVLFEGRYQVADWLELLGGIAPVLFGVLLAGGLLLAATLMLAVTAWRTEVRPSDAGDRGVYVCGLRLVLLALVLQALLAAALGRELLPLQPARVAAVVPQWTSGPPERLSLAAWPDASAGRDAWRLEGPAGWPEWVRLPAGGPLRGLDDLAGIRPPLLATYLSARLAVLLTGVLAAMAVWALWRGRRLGHEPDNLSRAGRLALRSMIWLAVALQAAGWGHLLIGSLPYAVQGTVALREIGTDAGESTLWAVLCLQIVVYGALAAGFRQLLRHATRYGVVPVARHRGRA
ncbi:Cytochrome d ubiquinol oxidase subunit I [Castellaniella defragrans 65Phen]|uniref:Cytochrome d ubiquinol oxidase subunit I n=1 Tax=Castellaniella defragrans (strain DSM 12143 / CCUG 39792 / 65Phen) TaxID=1437824 RepID=W8X5P5_CASD6|nr:cytochrome ubiquinol oxidase subunit I [Castellaniella defragrans]CDM25366.1 Cytochrome d ubiquinol oxidase subunit I [Castellaniella defragrans 65Phen]